MTVYHYIQYTLYPTMDKCLCLNRNILIFIQAASMTIDNKYYEKFQLSLYIILLFEEQNKLCPNAIDGKYVMYNINVIRNRMCVCVIWVPL